MDLAVFVRTLVRRWYLSLAVLVLTAVAITQVTLSVGPSYEAQGSVLIFPPVTTTTANGGPKADGNPYLELEGLSQARDIVIRSITSKTSREELAEDFPEAEFEATPDFTNGAPIVLFTVEAKDRDQATAALSELMDRVPETLVRLQDGLRLDDNSVITSVDLTYDERPDVVRKSQIRAALATGAVTLALGLLLIGLLDALLAARRRRKDRKSAGSAESPGAAVPPAGGPTGETRAGDRVGSRPTGRGLPRDPERTGVARTR